MSSSVRKTAEALLAQADVHVNGNRPWDIQVHDERFFARALGDGSLGLGESYMDGWWDAEEVDVMIEKLLRISLNERVRGPAIIINTIKARLFNMQNKVRAMKVITEHYDLGNDLYEKMLDPRMVYTCGYWEEGAKDLAEAQEHKLELICRKIGLKAGQKILDIGCGFGSFAKYAAEKFDAHVVGITLSKEQATYAKKSCEGLSVEIRLQDYRDVDEQFDHIVSIGMFEAVGYKNFRKYFEVAAKNLKEGGLFLLHTIGQNVSDVSGEPWSEKYIFPNGMLPSIQQIGSNIENIFVMEDWHNFGVSYSKTLLEWHKNFLQNWDELKHRYDERFHRMWEYYLLSFAGSFRSRYVQLWQIVLSKEGIEGGYRRPVLG